MNDFGTIARRVERKRALSTLQLSTSSLAVGGGFATYEGPGSFMNRACAMGLDGSVTSEDIESLIHFFESRGEEAKVEICPFAHASLIQGLGANGFVVQDFDSVLAIPLSPSIYELAVEAPDGIAIERVDGSDPSMARAFAESAERTFAKEHEPVSQSAVGLIMKSLLDPTNDSFVARTREGEIVGTASSDSSDGLTMLFGAGVAPSWRGHGLHGALMMARLSNGITRGSDLGCVIAAPGLTTEKNAGRLGFTMAYSRATLVRPLAR